VSREAFALLGAAAMHGLLALAVRASLSGPPPEPARAVASSSASETAVELEIAPLLDADAGSEQTPPASSRPEGATVREPRGRAPANATSVPELDAPPEPADGQPLDAAQPSDALALLPESPSASVLPAESAADDLAAAEVPARTGPIDLGIGDEGWRRWVAGPGERVATLPDTDARKAARRPLVRAPMKSTTGGLREGLEARDRALGLGPSGRVVSALHLAARHPDAPQLGTASFQVTVLRTGAVEVLLNNGSQPSGWGPVALRALEDLRRKPPRIAAGRSGVRLTVDLVAEAVLPNGVKSKSLRRPALEALAPRLQSTAEAQKEIVELNPTAGTDGGVPLAESLVNSEVSGVYAAGQGKVCSYRAGGTPLGTLNAPIGNPNRSPGLELRVQGNCDPANIGAKSQRVVRAAVRDEVMF
jgi:hypothetical protein